MDVLKIASTGLKSFSTALETTSHNIANAQTDGYSRQRVDLRANTASISQGNATGKGVHVASIQRISDEFASDQVRSIGSEQQRLDTFHQLATRIDGLVAEENTSLTPAMQQFFNSLEQLNTDPSSSANRGVVLSEGRNLVDRFNVMDQHLGRLNDEVNNHINNEVSAINSLSEGIAQLNLKIQSSTQGTQAPNDLLDQRNQLLEQLSGHVGIQTVTKPSGMVDVFTANGLTLVNTDKSYLLDVSSDPAQGNRLEVAYNGNIISQQLKGGSLTGALDFRREMLDSVQNDLGKLATIVGATFNAQHRQGLTLTGNPGSDFFSVAEPKISASHRNSGSGMLTVEISDATQLNGSDYELKYDGVNYSVTRLSDNSKTISNTVPMAVDGLSFSFSTPPGTGDSYLIQPTVNGARNIGMAIQNGNDIAVASPLRNLSNPGNTGSATLSPAKILDVTNPNLHMSVELRFSSETDYEAFDSLSGNSLGTGTLGPDATVNINGWQASIDGQVNSGDRFTVSRNTGGTGDNKNGRLLSELQFDKNLGGASTYQETYGSLVNKIGSLTRRTEINRDAQNSLLADAKTREDSISGVNLDDEAINLTRYQQSYQAAAQVIATSNTLFDTLLNVVRR